LDSNWIWWRRIYIAKSLMTLCANYRTALIPTELLP
jgi:hypothetical protein